jgi:restriction endonuclease S subunit
MKLKQLATVRVGLGLIRKRGDIHDNTFFRYKAVTLKAFSTTGVLLHNELDEFIANEKLNDNYITQEGNILVRLREPNIAVHIDKDSIGLIVPALMAIIQPRKDINSIYLTHFINSNIAQKQFQNGAIQGTTIPMIKTADLGDLEVNLPPIETQKKIVAILDLANKEIKLLAELSKLKTQFKNELLDTILKKEKNK